MKNKLIRNEWWGSESYRDKLEIHHVDKEEDKAVNKERKWNSSFGYSSFSSFDFFVLFLVKLLF